MERVHGVDVSWMTKHSPTTKDYNSKPQTPPVVAAKPEQERKPAENSDGNEAETPSKPKPIPTQKPGFTRTTSSDRTATLNGSKSGTSPSTGISRRNSWLSSISSKFSSSPTANNSQPNSPSSPVQQPPSTSAVVSVPPGPQTPRNAVLQHAVKVSGDAPYTPAPPKQNQSSFLQSAFRRLSSSSGQLAHAPRGPHHGLCERKVLNVDRNRERCPISDLDQSKLRRVAFCVDVEIASGPRYIDDVVDEKRENREKDQKKKLEQGQQGEAEALKHPEEAKDEKEKDRAVSTSGEKVPNSEKEPYDTSIEIREDLAVEDKDSKKKEKKKRSEEERKARKEKKRKLAEANGSIPVEVVRNDSDDSFNSSLGGAGGTRTPISQAAPTTDPVRIYRRCCQLRETPILKKLTEQLASPTNMAAPGVVQTLDLTGYWLQLPDLVSLGDYLAVVPVKEIIMENCGLSDEGVRVILAGLLAAKLPDHGRRRIKNFKDGEVLQGGIVERVVFKNNVKIGKDGWRHICLFINMCRSLKSLDLTKIPFPQAHAVATPGHHLHQTASTASDPEVSYILSKALGGRLAGRELELLNVAECGLSTEQLGSLVDGSIKSGLRRLGLAGIDITPEGIQHVARFLREGKCEGLDLGGNNLKDHLGTIAAALDADNILIALSLADCNLTPDSLWSLFPALSKLKNFRFIDLSQNHTLFDSERDAISLLRRYIPKMPILRRIHLADVSMSPDQAIAIAEILPESSSLAHLTIMENPQIAALANAKTEASQAEACALYASLMAAVRVSNTIICIDIEVPGNDSSEIVKALAKQVVAYCLRNMERGPVAEISQATPIMQESSTGSKEVIVPDVLLHLVGHEEDDDDDRHDDADSAPDEDYVIGGSGVVKALGVCLRNRGNDSRRPTTGSRSGTASPITPVHGGKAKDMSKNLLGSARKIRARLQPALVKESRGEDNASYQRLLFLDQTLEGMINRFEDEYPETRVGPQNITPPVPEGLDLAQESPVDSNSGSLEVSQTLEGQGDHRYFEAPMSEDEGENNLRPAISRHNSDVSLASRALNEEEGRMHRFGQRFRRDILKPDMEDHHHGTTGKEKEPKHLQILRAMVDGLGGDEIRERVHDVGPEALLNDMSKEAKALKEEVKAQDPEAWEVFVQSQKAAQRNAKMDGGPVNESSPFSETAPVGGSAIVD